VEELTVCFEEVFVLQSLHASKEPYSAEDLLLKDGGLKMANEFQVFYAVDVA
jgi:hypothetical protein